ncbi:MAG: hypothetical protein ABR567_19970 [Myxococcales bacterium]|nr:hypothetical protein [Myxococcales bacterium]
MKHQAGQLTAGDAHLRDDAQSKGKLATAALSAARYCSSAAQCSRSHSDARPLVALDLRA